MVLCCVNFNGTSTPKYNQIVIVIILSNCARGLSAHSIDSLQTSCDITVCYQDLNSKNILWCHALSATGLVRYKMTSYDSVTIMTSGTKVRLEQSLRQRIVQSAFTIVAPWSNWVGGYTLLPVFSRNWYWI